MGGRPRLISFLLVLLLAGCTSSRALVVEPLPGRAPATREQVYQAVVRAFSKAELRDYREVPERFAVESDWTYWPDSWGSILWGFPATVWKYRATVKEREVVVEAWGRGLNLWGIILPNLLPAPVEWLVQKVEQEVAPLGVRVRPPG